MSDAFDSFFTVIIFYNGLKMGLTCYIQTGNKADHRTVFRGTDEQCDPSNFVRL